jgi:hypothetical protein
MRRALRGGVAEQAVFADPGGQVELGVGGATRRPVLLLDAFQVVLGRRGQDAGASRRGVEGQAGGVGEQQVQLLTGQSGPVGARIVGDGEGELG